MTPTGLSGSESNGNEGLLHILQNSRTGTSPLDGLVSYLGHSLGESYSFTEIQSVYSLAPVEWAENERERKKNVGKAKKGHKEKKEKEKTSKKVKGTMVEKKVGKKRRSTRKKERKKKEGKKSGKDKSEM